MENLIFTMYLSGTTFKMSMELSSDPEILAAQLQTMDPNIYQLTMPRVQSIDDTAPSTKDLMRLLSVMFRHNTHLQVLDISHIRLGEGRDTHNLKELFRHNQTIKHLKIAIDNREPLPKDKVWLEILEFLISKTRLQTLHILAGRGVNSLGYPATLVFDTLLPSLINNLSLTSFKLNGIRESNIISRNKGLPHLVKKSIIAFLAVKKYYSKSTLMFYFPVEIIRKIAQYMWIYRYDLKWLKLA